MAVASRWPWRIDPRMPTHPTHEQSEEEIKAAVVEMVGAYLNAARWGEDGLRKRFDPGNPEPAP